MNTFLTDLRFAYRSLRRAPSFTCVALMTLAIGIGANTAIFSLIYGIMLQPLPYPASERIVRIWDGNFLSPAMVEHVEAEATAYQSVSAFRAASFSTVEDERPIEMSALIVTPSHFEVIGVQPHLGNSFSEQTRLPGGPREVILSDQYWHRRFGGDRGVIGKPIELAGRDWTVVGVMPQGYRSVGQQSAVWVPLVFDPSTEEYRDHLSLQLIGRLKPGIHPDSASRELQSILVGHRKTDNASVSQERAARARVVLLLETLVGETRPRLLFLAVAVGLILLIACTNVANLLLARGESRQRELGVRSTLGASRWNLVRLLLTESLLLGLAGGLLGVLVAGWSLAFFSETSISLPRAETIALGSPVLAYCAAISLGSGFLLALLPALRLGTARELMTSRGDGSSATRSSHQVNNALVAVEISFAVSILLAAALVVKSFWKLQNVEPGFEPRGLLALRINPPQDRYQEETSRQAFYRQVEERVSAIPGVESVTTSNILPVTSSVMKVAYLPQDHHIDDQSNFPTVSVRMVGGSYAKVLRTPLVKGRLFDRNDDAASPSVGLVNSTLANQLWPDGDPIGKRLSWDDGSEWLTIVGEIGDVHQRSLAIEPEGEVYVPYQQAAWGRGLFLLVRSANPSTDFANNLVPLIQSTISSIDKNVPLGLAFTMDQHIEASLAKSRQISYLLSTFAVLALVLASVGVYGVTSFMVSKRTFEIGVRIALGASRKSIMLQVLGRTLKPVVIGVGFGIGGAIVASSFLESLLFGVSTHDPVVLFGVVSTLLFAATIAAFLPAQQAAENDPVRSLRSS